MRILAKSISWLLALTMLTLSAWGTSDKAWIGIYTQTVDKDLQDAFALDSDDGVIIKMVVPDSPGDKAGLDEGDIILSINGETIVNSEHLSDYISHLKPGDQISIDLIQNGMEGKITMKLGEQADNDAYFNSIGRSPGSLPQSNSRTYTYYSDNIPRPFLGVSLQSLNEQLGEYFGVKDGEGVLITEVVKDSPAEKIGLKAGDVIIDVDGTKINKDNEVSQIVR
ncbi:MAG: PDZ domain-containing protein, partial [Candidatus Zixiibacteriota bacterium]